MKNLLLNSIVLKDQGILESDLEGKNWMMITVSTNLEELNNMLKRAYKLGKLSSHEDDEEF